METFDKNKRFIVCCYNFLSLCFFILSSISLLINNQIAFSAVIIQIYFISTFGYGLVGILTMRESFIKIFLNMLISVIIILTYHLFVLIYSLVDNSNQLNNESIQIIYGINIILILLLFFYIGVSFLCIKYSQELVVEIRKSYVFEQQMKELQTQMIQEQLDYENSVYLSESNFDFTPSQNYRQNIEYIEKNEEY